MPKNVHKLINIIYLKSLLVPEYNKICILFANSFIYEYLMFIQLFLLLFNSHIAVSHKFAYNFHVHGSLYAVSVCNACLKRKICKKIIKKLRKENLKHTAHKANK